MAPVSSEQSASAAPSSFPVRIFRPSSVGKLGHRYGWGVLDQVFSSLTNLALAIAVARTVSVESFGAFSIVFATYVITLGVSRALTTEPLTIAYSAREEELREAAARAVGTAVVAGIAFGAACVGAAAIAPDVLTAPLVALGVSMPGLLAQDAWRFVFFAARQGRHAFLNDAIWAAVLAFSLLLLLFGASPSVATFILAWGAAATTAAIIGGFQASIVPRPSGAMTWLREQRRLGLPFLAEFIAAQGATQFVLYAAAAVSLGAAGALRGAQLMLGPVQVLFMGIRLPLLPEAVRTAREDRSQLRRMVALLAVALASVASVWGIVILLLPSSLGVRALGSTWDAAHAIILPLTIASVASGVITAAGIGLRSLALAKRTLRARLLTAALIFPAGTVGAAVAGAAGAAAGLAVAGMISAGWWSAEFVRAMRKEQTIETVRSRR